MDQHYKVTITVKGQERVAFVTDLGWAEEMSVVLDCMNLEDAIASTDGYLVGLSPVPFMNDCDNEEHADAIEPLIEELRDTVKNMTVIVDGKIEFLMVHPSEIKITFEESYQVHFGE